MSLHLHRSARADRLVDALGAVLAEPLGDPMVAEVVSVPTRGVERWVAQRLAGVLGAAPGRHDGVCANVDFPFPARLVELALDATDPGGRHAGIWRPERLVWPLLEVVEECRDEPWLAALGPHVTGTGDLVGGGDRRFGAVRHVADLFDRYGVHRPSMVRAWARGEMVDGHGDPLPADGAWQARLWVELRARLDVASPAERLVDACRRVREEPGLVALPARVSLFGVTRVPASHAEVLRALADARDVHLFALHPSPALWDEVARKPPAAATPVPRRLDPSAGAAHNPLLASWGRDAREMQLVLTAGATVDDVLAVEETGTSLLGRLQADIRANEAPPGVPWGDAGGPDDLRAVLDPDDRSLAVHACHGRTRQVEVLRDAVLHLLAADASLEPRDIIVMCPDVEAFAPLVHAAFGSGADLDPDGEPAGAPGSPDAAGGRPVDLRVRLADRSLRQTNPVLGVVAELLDLAEARLTASQVLDLAGRGPVRARFRLDDDDLARLERWVDAAGIRWGLDAGHRAPYGLGGLDANTWRAGLDRLLLGAAMTEDDLPLVGGVLPVDDVDSGDLDLAGRTAEMIDRLAGAVDALTRPQDVVSWSVTIADAAAALTATGAADDWQPAELRRLLDDVVDEATGGDGPAGGTLTLPEMRTLLADRLRGRPTRANFRTGHLTVCTLVPMRSVPHRVVCLLGLDDALFPRPGAVDGDDLVRRAPCVGDRDGRSEDRQLFLDAVLAATDTLLVTYSGRDPRTNAPLPPAVPLGELLDVVDATVRTGDGAPARRRVVTEHPLQPFDPRNFTGEPGGHGPWSFDPVNLQGARALVRGGGSVPPRLAGPLPPLPHGTIELDDLVRFVQHPVRAFLRQRLGVSLGDRADEVADALPIEVDALGRWGVGQRMLAARRRGVPADTCRAAELARGVLPPGALGTGVVEAVAPVVEALVSVAGAHGGGHEPTAADVAVDLGGGDVLVGTVTGLFGTAALSVGYSSVRARQRLEAWVRLLALRAAQPGTPWTAVTVGPHRREVAVVTIGDRDGTPPLDAATATAHLRALADLYRHGMTRPLPLYCQTSAAWATAARQAAGRPGRPVNQAAAAKEWETDPNRSDWDREDRDADHRWALDGVVPFADLLVDVPTPDEEGPGWDDGQDTRFGRYALRLWDGLLTYEAVSE